MLEFIEIQMLLILFLTIYPCICFIFKPQKFLNQKNYFHKLAFRSAFVQSIMYWLSFSFLLRFHLVANLITKLIL